LLKGILSVVKASTQKEEATMRKKYKCIVCHKDFSEKDIISAALVQEPVKEVHNDL